MPGKVLSRKVRRKQRRSEKKSKKAEYFSNRKRKESQALARERFESKSESGRGKRDDGKIRTTNEKLSGSVAAKSSHSNKTARVRDWLALRKDEKEIARLEKLMKFRKKSKPPASFKNDGLDYILELTDADSQLNVSGSSEEESSASSDEPKEVETFVRRASSLKRLGTEQESSKAKLHKKEVATVKRVRFEVSEEDKLFSSEEDSTESESENSEGDYDEDMEEPEDESDEFVESESDDKGTRPGQAKTSGTGSYMPPQRREQAKGLLGRNKLNEHQIGTLERLRKLIQGQINRLSESNMHSIGSQIEQLYCDNSRNDMNATLTKVLMKACICPVLLGEKFAVEHMMLLALLHCHVGSEVGAYFIQALAEKFNKFHNEGPNYGQGKECDCVILLFSHLYNFKVIHCLLIYDVIRKLVEVFSERDVEMLLLLLKNCGMEIRRDDAASLKEIIHQIQSKASSSSMRDSPRMKFILDTIAAIKTNNVRKIPNYDPSLLEHKRRLLRGLARSSSVMSEETQLKISLSDLLSAGQQGRWWIVGSAWSGKETNASAQKSTTAVAKRGEEWVMDLARKQRMNTDIRKNIFCILVTSEDYLDAFEKLLHLNLKEVQEREVVHVLLDCCLQEKFYNPYYAYLSQKLCEYKRSNQVTFQYSIWDKFKELASLTLSQLTNFRKLLVHLIKSKALSLVVIKVVEFPELGKVGIRFFKKLLRAILCDCSEDTCRAIFARLAPIPTLKPLRDDLVVFMRHFLPSEQEGDATVSVKDRLRIAEESMKLAVQ